MPRNVAILIFADAEVLDFCGPLEVFSAVNRFEPAFNVFTVAEKSPVLAKGGLSVNPQYRLADCPRPDILLVPGGQGTRREMHNAGLIEWIRSVAGSGDVGRPCYNRPGGCGAGVVCLYGRAIVGQGGLARGAGSHDASWSAGLAARGGAPDEGACRSAVRR